MATSIRGFSFSADAGVDLTGKENLFAVADNNGKAALPAANGAASIGVIDVGNSLGGATTIQESGIAKVISNGTIAASEKVSCAITTGKAKQSASGEYVLGIALTGDGGADGVLVEVLLKDMGPLP